MADEPAVRLGRQRMRGVALDHQHERLARQAPLPVAGELAGDGKRGPCGHVVGHVAEHRAHLAEQALGRVEAGRRRLAERPQQRPAADGVCLLDRRFTAVGQRPPGHAARHQVDSLH